MSTESKYSEVDTTLIQFSKDRLRWVDERALQHAFGYYLQREGYKVMLEYKLPTRQQVDIVAYRNEHETIVIEAKNAVMMNIHDSYKPVGQLRSYRRWLYQEYGDHFAHMKLVTLVQSAEDAVYDNLINEGIGIVSMSPQSYENWQKGRSSSPLAWVREGVQYDIERIELERGQLEQTNQGLETELTQSMNRSNQLDAQLRQTRASIAASLRQGEENAVSGIWVWILAVFIVGTVIGFATRSVLIEEESINTQEMTDPVEVHRE